MTNNIFAYNDAVVMKGNKPFSDFDDATIWIGQFLEKSDPGPGPNHKPTQVRVKLVHPVTKKEMLVSVHRHMLTYPPAPPTEEAMEGNYIIKGYIRPEPLDYCWYGKWIVRVKEGNALSSPAWVLEPTKDAIDEMLPDIAPPETIPEAENTPPAEELQTFILTCPHANEDTISKLPKDSRIIKEQSYCLTFKSPRSWEELKKLLQSAGTVAMCHPQENESLKVAVRGAVVVAEEQGKETVKITLANEGYQSAEDKELKAKVTKPTTEMGK